MVWNINWTPSGSALLTRLQGERCLPGSGSGAAHAVSSRSPVSTVLVPLQLCCPHIFSLLVLLVSTGRRSGLISVGTYTLCTRLRLWFGLWSRLQLCLLLCFLRLGLGLGLGLCSVLLLVLLGPGLWREALLWGPAGVTTRRLSHLDCVQYLKPHAHYKAFEL